MSVSLSITLIYTLLSTTKAYHLSLHSLEWQNASNYCQSYCKSTLASVHSREDHLTTLDIINRNPSVYTRVWTGLNDIKFSDSWEWSDGSLFDFGHIKDTTTGKVIRGTYPWRSDEPDYNDTDQCVALEVGWLYPGYTSGRWIDRKQTANYHFLCNDCSSRIHKYAVVNGGRNVTAAESICQSRFGTSLASVHSHTDMQEAMASCEQITSSNGCWLGLTDAAQHRVYQWTDGTPWDYGRDFHEYPWYKSEPGSTQDQKCIFLDPRNGADEGTYRWDDYWCNSKLPRALCNAPSEICYPGQFFIPKGSPIDWTWTTKPCGVSKSKLIRQSIALLGNKQYLNTDGRLVVDMMYSIPVVGLDGNAGLAFYFDETQCDHYYYVGIWAAHSLIFLGKQTGNQDTLDWATIKYNSINPTYTLGQHYTLRVELTNGVDWKVYLNDALALTVTDDHFNNINNKLSGYIAIRSTYSAIDVKSLYISGEAQYFDDNSWFLQCTDSPTSAPTQPTLMPTADPTLEPTTPIPSHAPTVSPSGAPTTPTAPPTTAAPSIPPTTGEPTVSPTYFPTIEPTVVPSVAPTVDPTIDPTIDPTSDPTSPPTIDPTNRPTLDPTPSPTRFPTVSKAYDSFFVIRYLILNLQQEHIDILLNNTQTVSDEITDIIEKSYSDDEVTRLPLEFFWLEIKQILGLKIKDIDRTKYPQFLNSQKEIPLNCTIKCNTDSCDVLLKPQFQEPFQSQAQSKLSEYFGHNASNASPILFQIDGDVDAIQVKPLYVEDESILDNYVLLASFAIITVCFMMSVCALAHNKQKFCLCKQNAMDDAIWIVFLVYGLQIIDFASDINLSMEMMFNPQFTMAMDRLRIVTICGLSSIVFIVLPYSVNLFFAIRIRRKLPKKNKMAISYFTSRSLFFVSLMILCGGCFPALTMVSSGVFGLKQLNSGLTLHELRQMNRIKMIGTIWLENVPQLMIQIMYANAIGNISLNTAFSFVASTLSILVVVTSYLIERTDENITTFTYFVHVKKENNQSAELDGELSEDEKKTFVANKGKTEGLGKEICASFGCNYKDIEVSKNSEITDNGLDLYVIHHTHSHMTLRVIETVYAKPSMHRKFREYFDLSSDFVVQFKRTARGDSEHEDQQDFTDAMRRLMERQKLNFNSADARQDFLRMCAMDTEFETMVDGDGLVSAKHGKTTGSEQVISVLDDRKTRDVVAHKAYASDSVSLVDVSAGEGGKVELQAIAKIKVVSGSSDVLDEQGLAKGDDPDDKSTELYRIYGLNK
eukprot:453992_1